MVIKKGDKVKIDYTGKLDDGTVFDSSEGKQPIEFEVGSGQVIPGFDEAVIGMKKGDEKDINIPPEKAYGNRNPELEKDVPKSVFPKDHDIKEGMTLMMGTPDGKKFAAKVAKISTDKITLDLNHPLAGQTLNFKIKLVE